MDEFEDYRKRIGNRQYALVQILAVYRLMLILAVSFVGGSCLLLSLTDWVSKESMFTILAETTSLLFLVDIVLKKITCYWFKSK